MIAMPKKPLIYHITHVDNLTSVINDYGLWSDAQMIKKGKKTECIGMSEIKQRRLKLPVSCYRGDCVGDYVPFYFCPRSVMLYIIHMGNHVSLTYRGGQRQIIHLEADMIEVVRWANGSGCRWAFTLSNAGANYTEFCNSLEQLNEIDWEAVGSNNFSDRHVKEGKQAEYLLHGYFPWNLIRRIGVYSPETRSIVLESITNAKHRPVVEVMRNWYF